MSAQNNWIFTTIGNLCSLVTGKTPSTKDLDNFGGGIPFAKPGDLDKTLLLKQTEETLTQKGLFKVPTLPPNTILVSCIGNLGKKAILAQTGSCNQQINAILPSPYIDSKFIYYYIDIIKEWMIQHASATTVTILNKSKFQEAPIPVPPLAEQKRIVKKIEELFAVIDKNKLQIDGKTDDVKSLEPLSAKLRAFGWDVAEVDGHDEDELESAFKKARTSSVPFAIIANTIKGKGVSFMESNVNWHGKAPNDDELKLALEELDA